jgi:hypothetical protein
MLTRKQILWCAVALAGLTVWAAAAVHAENGDDPIATPVPILRECTIQAGDSEDDNVRILAGPAGSGCDLDNGASLAPNFPVKETCPSPFTGECLKWEYRWCHNFYGESSLKDFVSFDSDLTVLKSNPSYGVSVSSFGNDNAPLELDGAGERFLTFNSSYDEFEAKFWTRPGIDVGTVTAGFEYSEYSNTFCRIAGADNLISNPQLAQTTQVVDQVGPCSITRTVSAQGCTVEIDVGESGCTLEPEAFLQIDGENSLAVSCDTQVTVIGSTRYCYPTSTGKMKCVTLP